MDKYSRYQADREYEEFHSLSVPKPERNLLAAILSRAILDYLETTIVPKPVVRSAEMWITDPIKIHESFSFGWVASHLDLDPPTLQNQLKEIRKDSERGLEMTWNLAR